MKNIIFISCALLLLVACTTPVIENDEDTLAPNEPTIPLDCVSWFDGCNTCMVENGELTGCTRRACDVLEPAECMVFEEPQEEPRACCLALTASCLACAEGVTEEEYCSANPETAGCS